MDRRSFIKSSVLAAAELTSGPGVRGAIGEEQPGKAVAGDIAGPAALIEIPAMIYMATDPVTTVPVTVSIRRFLISPYETTQQSFEEVMGYNPSFHPGRDLPVEQVTWWEAIRYCNVRSKIEKLDPCYNLETGVCDDRRNGYRLPAEVEWIHASEGDPGDLYRRPAPWPKDLAAQKSQVDCEASRAAEIEDANLGSSDTTHLALLMRRVESGGTKPVGSSTPNRYGLYNMIGNVWEWCNDYFDPRPSPVASRDPAGPPRGLARVIHGGSFISTTATDWAGGYRSSMEPGYKSRFTGFRVCRTVESAPEPSRNQTAAVWAKPYNNPPPGYGASLGGLEPLVSRGMTLPEWNRHRLAIQAKWSNLLGSMELEPPEPAARLAKTVGDQNFTAKILYLQVEPDWWEKILVMMPLHRLAQPCAAVIVPFYDVDDPYGHDLSGRRFNDSRVEAFARMAVQKGYIAVAIRWFGESYGESFNEAVANLRLRHPHSTGMGKWIWDSQRLVDYLLTLPEVDAKRIGIIGHSLGGKMALYAAAFDPRISVVVANELGIGLKFSNYDSYWYFGSFIHKAEQQGTDQQEIVGLIAPRPFLLIGGDKFDTAKSWYYINAARQVYDLYGKHFNIGYYNHHKGHMPTPEADWLSVEWLTHFLGDREA